jgi:hypothetical protein
MKSVPIKDIQSELAKERARQAKEKFAREPKTSKRKSMPLDCMKGNLT